MKSTQELNNFLSEAWEYSRQTLSYWSEQLEKNSTPKINGQLWNLLCCFYNEYPEKSYSCFLHISPIDGNRGGEPMTNFLELQEKTSLFDFIGTGYTDILLWLPYVKELEDGGVSTFAHDYDIYNDIFHELTHLYLQRDNTKRTIQSAESVDSVRSTLARINKYQDWYVEITLELITLYINEYIYRIQSAEMQLPKVTSVVPFIVEPVINEDFFKKILGSTILYDVRYLNGTGAMARKRIRWGELLGSLPREYAIQPDETEAISDRDKFNVYLVAKQLPFDLAKEYLQNGKSLDVEFIVNLYKLVESYIDAIDQKITSKGSF